MSLNERNTSNNPGYYHYNLYQAYYPAPEHKDSERAAAGVSRPASLPDSTQKVLADRLCAQLGYPKPEAELAHEFWSQA